MECCVDKKMNKTSGIFIISDDYLININVLFKTTIFKICGKKTKTIRQRIKLYFNFLTFDSYSALNIQSQFFKRKRKIIIPSKRVSPTHFRNLLWKQEIFSNQIDHK